VLLKKERRRYEKDPDVSLHFFCCRHLDCDGNSCARQFQGESLGRDGNALSFKMTVSGIKNVTAVHIHIGKKGENGPPAVFLFHGPEKKGTFNGTLAEGTITGKDLFGPLSGKSIEDLMAKINSGDAYVVVHTEQNPGGELRGQIR
jgi:CHRD domain